MHSSRLLDGALIWFFTVVTLVMLWHGANMMNWTGSVAEPTPENASTESSVES